MAFYLSRSSSLAETLAKMISSERKRRLAYKQDIEASQLPFSMGSAMDGTPPTTEVNNVGGVSEEAFGLERKDVEGGSWFRPFEKGRGRGREEETRRDDRADLESCFSLHFESEYLDLLAALEKDPELLELVGEGGWNPVTELRTTLMKYVEKLDRLVPDFDKMAEKTREFFIVLSRIPLLDLLMSIPPRSVMSGSRLARSRRTCECPISSRRALFLSC